MKYRSIDVTVAKFTKDIFAGDIYCWYCLDNLACTKDHIIPRSRGGIGLRGNKIPACRRCQDIKGHKQVEELLEHLKKWENGKHPIGDKNINRGVNKKIIVTMIEQTKLLIPYIKIIIEKHKKQNMYPNQTIPLPIYLK